MKYIVFINTIKKTNVIGKKLFTLFICFSSLPGMAQHDLNLTNDLLTPAWYNPASFGTWNKLSVNLTQQLPASFLPGNPGTFIFNAEAKLKYPNSTFSNGTGITFKMDESYWGRTTTANANYNFQWNLKKISFSFGAAPGIKNISVGPTGHTLDQTKFSLGTGLMIYNKKFYFGMSAANISDPNYDKLGFSTEPAYYAQAGYQFNLFEKIVLFPTANFVSDNGWNIGSGMLYLQLTKPKITVGIGCNSRKDFKGSLGYELKNFAFFYVIGRHTSTLTNANYRLQEFRLSFTLPD